MLFLLVFAVTACGTGDEQETVQPVENNEPSDPQPDEQPDPKEDETDKEEEETFKYTAPFTGVGTNDELPKRAVMVMINNHAKARPQSGLDKADVVYEVLAEGSITRMAAIYHSQKPKVIGPVRSVRPYYIDLGLGFDAVIVHAGGSPAALQILRDQGIAHMDEIYNAGAYFWRESFRKAPHNLYTDLERIYRGAERLGFRQSGNMPHMLFVSEDREPEGDTAEKIDISYTSTYGVSYEYDPDSKQYKRLTQGEPHNDLTTGEQLTATNVLVVSASHRILDNEGRRAIDVYGPGNGYLFQRGKVQKVTWERKNGLIRAYIDGEEVGLYPGNTWVHIIPNVPALENKVTYQ